VWNEPGATSQDSIARIAKALRVSAAELGSATGNAMMTPRRLRSTNDHAFSGLKLPADCYQPGHGDLSPRPFFPGIDACGADDRRLGSKIPFDTYRMDDLVAHLAWRKWFSASVE